MSIPQSPEPHKMLLWMLAWLLFPYPTWPPSQHTSVVLRLLGIFFFSFFVMKKSTAFIHRMSSKQDGQLMLNGPELPDSFQARVFKD